MVNKKYLLIAGLCTMFGAQSAMAQESSGGSGQYGTRDLTYRGAGYDVLDTAYVPKFRMNQHREFLNHQYDFPSKPRTMWEVGVGGGLYNVSGDVPSLMLWNGGGGGFHAHVRKSFGYVLSGRIQYNYGIAKGLNWKPATNYIKNGNVEDQTGWISAGYNPIPDIGSNPNGPTGVPVDNVFYNYRMESHQLNLDLIANLNNILFHKARNVVNVYALAGLGGLAYQTRLNALDANGNKYTDDNGAFAMVAAAYGPNGTNNPLDDGGYRYENRNEIRKMLRENMDKSYETLAETEQKNRRPGIFKNKTLVPAWSVGLGVAFKVTPRINIQLEDRISGSIGTDEDLLDGQRWQEHSAGDPVLTPNRDHINYLSLGVNFNIGNKRNSVEPLYWMNPLDFAYNELTAPRRMKLPDGTLTDSDGDGVADQLDKCPGTPAGVAVDVHGCPLDTDGDGVPDYLDKQLITPTECQPVDADGVGDCPCHCDGVVGCANIGAGSLTFASGSARLTSVMQSQLANLAAQMSANPTCKVVITGNGSGSKVQQQRSWDRVNAIIEYLSETQGVDRNRFIFRYGADGDANTVTYRAAQSGEEGTGNVAPPFPNLRRD